MFYLLTHLRKFQIESNHCYNFLLVQKHNPRVYNSKALIGLMQLFHLLIYQSKHLNQFDQWYDLNHFYKNQNQEFLTIVLYQQHHHLVAHISLNLDCLLQQNAIKRLLLSSLKCFYNKGFEFAYTLKAYFFQSISFSHLLSLQYFQLVLLQQLFYQKHIYYNSFVHKMLFLIELKCFDLLDVQILKEQHLMLLKHFLHFLKFSILLNIRQIVVFLKILIVFVNRLLIYFFLYKNLINHL